ncbi:MAG: aspartyl/asparaginyl beta-hydroxylase domain-containing protein [Pseudoxanthomonas sp.]
MKLHAPFVQLPILFDALQLAEEIGSLDKDSWRPHPQNFPGNSMMPLVAVDGDPGNEGFAGPMRPTPQLAALPYLQQVLASLGATVGRTRLMRLSGQAEVTRHADQHYYWTERVRVHVPVVTQPTVRFECGDAGLNMAPGECWIFDTWRQHRVLNADDRPRIHLVCDTVGGAEFWKMVYRGRPVGIAADSPGWTAQTLEYAASSPPPIPFENYNLPQVMSPWELERHLDFLVEEMIPSPHQITIHRHVRMLYHAWRGLWAAHADAAQAVPEYRRLLDGFLAQVKPMAGESMLRNELSMLPALMSGIARVAVLGHAEDRLG